ncbi:MAG: hypothetical protein AB7K24_01995 [Gemmataceae bacterium]
MSEPQEQQQPQEFKSEQYEFNAEQNRTINELAASMEVVAMLMKVVGTIFLIFFALTLMRAVQLRTGYGAVIGLGAAMLMSLSIGFWTSGSAGSFRQIVESQNRDVWHLMKAIKSLQHMYSLLRTIILGGLVTLVIGLALLAYERYLATP